MGERADPDILKNQPYHRRSTVSGRRMCAVWCALTIAVAHLGACGTGNDPELVGVRAILYGRVISESQQPIAGAEVKVSHHPAPCGSGAIEVVAVQTDTNGRCRLEFVIFSSADGCMRFRFAEARFAPDSASVEDVPFRPRPPWDSVETNMILRSR